MPRKRKSAAAAAVAGNETDGSAAASERSAPEFDFARSFQRFNEITEFARFCSLYPDQSGTVSYLYRLQPVINRKQVGIDGSSLEKVTGRAVDYDYVSQKWGSGLYQVSFNDLNKPSNLNKIASCKFEVSDPTLPPVVNPSELVIDSPDNSAVISKFINQGWTIADSKNNLLSGGFRVLVPPASGGGSAAEKVLAETVQKLALEREAPVDDSKYWRELALALLNKPAAAPAASDDSKLKDQLILKAFDALARRSADPPAVANPAPVDPIRQMRDTLGLMREAAADLGYVPASGAASPGDLLGGFAPMITETLKSLAFGFGQAMASKFLAPAAAAGAAAPGALPFLPSAVPGGISPAAAGPVPPAPAAAPSPQPAPVPPVVIPPGSQYDQLCALGNAAVAAFEGGANGYDFAERLCGYNETESIYDGLLAAGRDGIMNGLAMVPGLMERIAPKRAAFDAWLGEFLDYGNDADAAEPPAALSQNLTPEQK